ncbi:MAG: thioesterase [Desulfobacterales bacterium]|nr:thioesterase [Desulfobacterales bacterium]
MKVEWCCKTGYMDIGPAFRLRLAALARMLQESAVTHSEQVGIRSRDLVSNGTAWVLNKMAFSIRRLPTFGEEIRVLTWHKGSRGFKALRDFEVLAGEESLVSVASLWLFIDLEKKRPRRIPPEFPLAYTIETDNALDCDLDGWRPNVPAREEKAVAITLRSSDFDPHGHVNNTVYFDFIETLLEKRFDGDTVIQGLRIQFRREIPRHVAAVAASFSPSTNGGFFRIFNGAETFVHGEVDLTSASGL